jgi:predicted RND superfamily exporter protein
VASDKSARASSRSPNSRVSGAIAVLARRPVAALVAIGAATAALLIPLLTMAPTTSASTEPGGPIFAARDRVNETFASSVYDRLFIVEHESGQILTANTLNELLEAQNRLRQDPVLGPSLLDFDDLDSGLKVTGMLTLADLVDAELRAQGFTGGLADASDEQVLSTGSSIIDRLGPRSDLIGISAQSTRNDQGWVVPALAVPVLSDNGVLGFGTLSVNLGGGTEAEEYNRAVQAFFRQEGWVAHGAGIDLNLTAQEQGAIAGPFIGLTILAILVLVGVTFRSYWILATISAAFLLLLIWLKGVSNLIGFEDDLILSLIVPVAMISFGVDFAFHALGRYREERASGHEPVAAYRVGIGAVSGALLLAFGSDAAAFLANASAGIDSIVQFGIGAALALLFAYLLLGLATPLVVAHIEARVPQTKPGRAGTIGRVAAGLSLAALTVASVMLLVFVLPWAGAGLAILTVLIGLVLPFWWAQRQPGPRAGDAPVNGADAQLARPMGSLVTAFADRPRLILPAAVALTVVAVVLALRVPAQFDVEDYLSPNTDFVVGLDQLARHVDDRGGEPAQIFIEVDAFHPAALTAIDQAAAAIEALDTPWLAQDGDGVLLRRGVLDVIEAVWASDTMADLVESETGVTLTDEDGDGFPDSAAQVEAALAVAARSGIPFDSERLLLTPDDVAIAVDVETNRTHLEAEVTNGRSAVAVQETFDALAVVADELRPRLAGSPDDSERPAAAVVQVTGSAFVREASLQASVEALRTSLPLAFLACFILSSLFLRSVRFGLISLLPVTMVLTWLYAFMYLAGIGINLVTATIAAVSVGIGIDFAIHFIVRYRDELASGGRRRDALRATGEGTGVALMASAGSSAVGFAIMAFAPMPLFATYGLLTALMVLLALSATLVVLPPVLRLATKDGAAELQASDRTADPATGPEPQLDPVSEIDLDPEIDLTPPATVDARGR